MDQEHFWILLSRRFADEASPADVRELDQLLESDPACRARYEALCRYWDEKDRHPSLNVDAVFQKTLGKIKSQAGAGENAPAALPAYFTEEKDQ